MRPLKYGEEMVQVNMRLPKSKVKEIQDMVSEYLKKFENGGGLSKTQIDDIIILSKTDKPKWAIDAEERMKRNKG